MTEVCGVRVLRTNLATPEMILTAFDVVSTNGDV